MEEAVSIIELDDDIANAEPPPLLPKGQYLATIQKAEVKTSANTGNDYIQVQYLIVTGKQWRRLRIGNVII